MARVSAEDRILQLEQQVTRLQHRLTAEQSKTEALQYRLSQQERQHGQPSKNQAASAQTSSTEGSLPEQMQQMTIERSRVAAEKADLENALEAEQEYIMHKLSKQLQAVKHDKEMLGLEKQGLKSKVRQLNQSVRRLCQEKVELERSLELEEEAFVNSLFRQVAHVMDNYHAMDQAMQKHGIRITQMAPQSPRVVLKRASLASHASADGTSTPTAAVRAASPVVHSASASQRGGGGVRPHSARRDSMPFAGNSPGAGLHATREHLEALSRSALRHNTVRSEDSMGSMSSMGSMMSAMSRDPSASRDGLPLPPSSAATGGGHSGAHAAASAAHAAAHGPQSAAPSSAVSTPSESGRIQK